MQTICRGGIECKVMRNECEIIRNRDLHPRGGDYGDVYGIIIQMIWINHLKNLIIYLLTFRNLGGNNPAAYPALLFPTKY